MNENVMEPRNNQKEKTDEKCNKIRMAEVKTMKALSMLKCDVWRAKMLTDKGKNGSNHTCWVSLSGGLTTCEAFWVASRRKKRSFDSLWH